MAFQKQTFSLGGPIWWSKSSEVGMACHYQCSPPDVPESINIYHWGLNVTLLLLLILLFLLFLFFLLFLLFQFLWVEVIPVIFLRNSDVHGCRMNQIWNLMTLNIQDSRLSYLLLVRTASLPLRKTLLVDIDEAWQQKTLPGFIYIK